jgi:4'-phosphopantetheinyl transferase
MLYIMEETRIPEAYKERFFLSLPFRERSHFRRQTYQKSAEQSVLARMLLLYGLNRETGMRFLPEMEKDPLGKPYFPERPELFFNMSHSGSGIFCGISQKNLGVDIQSRITYRESLAKRILHEREWGMLQKSEEKAKKLTELWCIKEAYVKYTGKGLRTDFRKLDFSEVVFENQRKQGRLFFRLHSNEQGTVGVCSEERMEKSVKVPMKELCSQLEDERM